MFYIINHYMCNSVGKAYNEVMIQEPKYTLIKQENAFELRHYQSYTLVESKDSGLRGYSGFQLAFNFIQGENDRNQKISMTAPVVNQLNEEGVITTAFVMPPQMKYDDVPEPSITNLKKVFIPEKLIAVIRFGFSPKMDSIRKYEQSLLEWIDKENYSVTGTLQLARYNPPFIPGFLKRNELWLEVIPKERT
jgi:hypothetical protein